MVVIDTSAWIDYLRGSDTPCANAVDEAMDSDRVIVGDLIIVELLQGIKNPKEHKQVEELTDGLDYRSFVGKEIAKKTADNYRILRSKGLTVRKMIDMMLISLLYRPFGLVTTGGGSRTSDTVFRHKLQFQFCEKQKSFRDVRLP